MEMAAKIYMPFIGILFFLMQGCTTLHEGRMLKKMEGKIPATSKWLGGRDGGVWVNITLLPQNIIEISVYNDFTGTKISELTYEHSCKNINEKLVFKALNYFADGIKWYPNNSITKCVKLKEKAPN